MAPGISHAGEAAVHGSATIRFLTGFRVNWAILGASGLTTGGAADALIEAADVYAVMAEQAARTFADSGKFDRVFLARWAGWSEIDGLASERPPQGALLDGVRAGSADILTA
jgi:DeoR/GlpR family transcriptional regulator of sugar metabolism